MKKCFLFLSVVVMSFAIVSCSNSPKAEKAEVKEAAKKQETANTATQTIGVNLTDSKVNWTGNKPAGSHTGYVNLKEGALKVDKGGDITGGSFVLDMNTITCTDLEGDYKASLEGHLKGLEADGKDDFFNVTDFPTASFDITKVAKLAGDADASHLIYGNLTLKGVTKEVGFKAKLNNDNGKYSISSPDFSINRTDFGIKFMSKSFFDDLKDKYINDDIVLSINLVTG